MRNAFVIAVVLVVCFGGLWLLTRPIQPTDDSEHAAYVDSVNALLTERDELIRTLWDTVFARDAVLDSFRNIRMNPEVLHQEAAQKTDGAPLDTLINELEKSVQ
jgi:hypothetical protein